MSIDQIVDIIDKKDFPCEKCGSMKRYYYKDKCKCQECHEEMPTMFGKIIQLLKKNNLIVYDNQKKWWKRNE